MNNVYKIFAEMPSLEMTNIIRDIRLSQKRRKESRKSCSICKDDL